MMTIRVSTGQKDLNVCIAALKFAFDIGVSEMRTKWFSITATDGLRWKSVAFGADVLGQVAAYVSKKDDCYWAGFTANSEYLLMFADYIGVHSI